MCQSQTNRFHGLLLSLVVGLSFLVISIGSYPSALWAQNAAAQPAYKRVPRNGIDAKRRKELDGVKKKVLMGTTPLSSVQDNFKKWCFDFFAKLTWPDDNGNFSHVAGDRIQLERDLQLAQGRNPEAWRFLRDTASRFAGQLIKANVHPVARVNAALILGNLNDQEGTRTPPIPHAASRKLLIDAFNSDKQIEGVKVAALVGLVRHVELETVQQQITGSFRSGFQQDRSSIAQIALKLLSSDQPPPGRSMDGHRWMQRRAIDILGMFGVANETVISGLERILQDETAPKSLRCAAAETMGKLQNVKSGNMSANIDAIGLIAVDSCTSQLSLIQQFEEEQAKNPRSSFYEEGEPPLSSDEPLSGNGASDEPVRDPRKLLVMDTQRRLISELGCIRTALVGPDGSSGLLKLAQSEPNAGNYQRFGQTINTLLAGLRKRDLDLESVKTTLQTNTGATCHTAQILGARSQSG